MDIEVLNEVLSKNRVFSNQVKENCSVCLKDVSFLSEKEKEEHLMMCSTLKNEVCMTTNELPPCPICGSVKIKSGRGMTLHISKCGKKHELPQEEIENIKEEMRQTISPSKRVRKPRKEKGQMEISLIPKDQTEAQKHIKLALKLSTEEAKQNNIAILPALPPKLQTITSEEQTRIKEENLKQFLHPKASNNRISDKFFLRESNIRFVENKHFKHSFLLSNVSLWQCAEQVESVAVLESMEHIIDHSFDVGFRSLTQIPGRQMNISSQIAEAERMEMQEDEECLDSGKAEDATPSQEINHFSSCAIDSPKQDNSSCESESKTEPNFPASQCLFDESFCDDDDDEEMRDESYTI